MEIRVDSGYIQTKYEYETEWTNLIPLSALIGPQGLASYIHIKWHAEGSTILLDTPEAYIGIYADNTEEDSALYDDYQWYKSKGEKGDPGNMTGPASSVDGNIPIFDGIAGDKVKDSGVKLADKANTADVNAALALKADKTYVDTNLATKAPLTSPALTGTPTAPIAPQGTNTNQIATTAHVFLAMMEGDWA